MTKIGATQIPQNQDSGIGKKTVIAAGTGFAVGAGTALLNQKQFLGNKELAKDTFNTIIKVADNHKKGSYIRNYYANYIKNIKKVAQTGKFNLKYACKTGGKAAAIVAGIYLGYKAIKGLFSSPSNKN